MKMVALTFKNADNSNQSILGYLDDEIDKEELRTDELTKYQIRSDDDGRGDPVTIENKVVVNHFGDFITDTPIKFPLTDNASDGYALIDQDYSIDYLTNNEYETEDFNLDDKLEDMRKHLLAETINEALKDADICGDPILNHVSINSDGNIQLNFYGQSYTLEIYNDKEFE